MNYGRCARAFTRALTQVLTYVGTRALMHARTDTPAHPGTAAHTRTRAHASTRARTRARTRTLAALAAGALATATLTACSSDPADAPDPTVYAQQLFDGANDEREVAGLDPLEWSDCLLEPALERAEVAAGTDLLQHETLALECADGARAAENLSRSDEPASDIVRQWMESPGHEANILDRALTVGAVGCVSHDTVLTCSWLAHA